MKGKLIKKVISNKINHWIESIDDEKVKELCKENVIVTGGCIVSLLTNEKVNDYDVYFRNKETVKAVVDYYIRKFKERKSEVFNDHKLELYSEEKDDRIKIICKSVGVVSDNSGDAEYKYFENSETLDVAEDNYIDKVTDIANIANNSDSLTKDTKYYPKFFTSNAITLSHDIQLIVRFYGEPEIIHKNYDFIHCTCYWDIKDNVLEMPAGALESIITKNLHYVGSLYPVCSVIRTRKFLKRDWHINGGEYLKMCFQISQLNLTDITVLEDQLVGVDAAYFNEIIDIIKADQLKNADLEIDNTYIFKLIDKIF